MSAKVPSLILWLWSKSLVAWTTSASLQKRLSPGQLKGFSCLGMEVLTSWNEKEEMAIMMEACFSGSLPDPRIPLLKG
jgi:hypothetical protein